MAHDNFRHLDRLVEAIEGPNTAIYIHIDQRADIPTEARFLERATLIPRRKTEWGAHAQLRASIDLLEAAEAADFYLLLSGSDYPLCSRTDLEKILATAPLFMNSKAVPFPSKPLQRFTKYHFKNLARRHPNLKNQVLISMERILKRLPFDRKPPLKLYAGSTWFALSQAVRKEFLEIHGAHPEYEEFFKNCLCPDEAFFQCLLGASSFLNQANPNLTYLKWEESAASPKYLELEDLEFLKRHQEFEDLYGLHQIAFGRKFNDESSLVCKWIDKNLRGL